jgi:hypothetical protein
MAPCSVPPLCPDLVIELASPSVEAPRGVTALRSKMGQYQANRATLGTMQSLVVLVSVA